MRVDMKWLTPFNKTNLSWIVMLVGGSVGSCTSLFWTLRLLRRVIWQNKRRRQNVWGCLSLAPDPCPSRRRDAIESAPWTRNHILSSSTCISPQLAVWFWGNYLSSWLCFSWQWCGYHHHCIFSLLLFSRAGDPAAQWVRAWTAKASYLGLNIGAIIHY